MRTIIVPIDFSAASMNAADYALQFAIVTECNLSLVHVCEFPIAYSEVPLPPVALPEMIEEANQKLVELQERLLESGRNKIKIHTEVKEGHLIDQLEEYCSAIQPYAVVMGARGVGRIERMLFGSSTLSAIRNLSWPLIIVPSDASFKNIARIGLATDLKDVADAIHVDTIKQILKDFGAELHVLHVYTAKTGLSVAEEVQESAWLREMLEESQPIFHFFNDENVEEAIGRFAEKIELDLLLVFPKKHGFFEGIWHKSQSKQIALHSHIPLMSIHE